MVARMRSAFNKFHKEV